MLDNVQLLGDAESALSSDQSATVSATYNRDTTFLIPQKSKGALFPPLLKFRYNPIVKKYNFEEKIWGNIGR